MLARIRFVQRDKQNQLTKSELDKLEDYLGERVSADQMKMGEKGEPESVSWRETFDEAKAKESTEYSLVIPYDAYQITSSETYIVDLEAFTSAYPNLEFSIKGMPKSVGKDNSDLIESMKAIAEKIEDAKNRFDKVVEFNQSCNVHVPNLGLLNINKLAYATDICTELLQDKLTQGWRIISVCPQPDQRRPDYILGMHVSDVENRVEVQSFFGEGREEGLKERDKQKA